MTKAKANAKAKTSKDQKFTRTRIPKHSQKRKLLPIRSYRHRNRKLRPQKMFCKICYDTNEPEHVYTGHYPRNGYGENAIITCPKLMAIQCHKCGEHGHTTSYCGKFSSQNKHHYNTYHHQEQHYQQQQQKHHIQSHPKKPLYTIHKYIPGKYFNKHTDTTTRQPTPTNIYDIFNNETTQTPTTSPLASPVLPLHLLKPLPLERCGPHEGYVSPYSSNLSYSQIASKNTYDIQPQKLNHTLPTKPMRMTMKEVEDKIKEFNQTLLNMRMKNHQQSGVEMKMDEEEKEEKKEDNEIQFKELEYIQSGMCWGDMEEDDEDILALDVMN